MSSSGSYYSESDDEVSELSEATLEDYNKQFIKFGADNWCRICNVKVPYTEYNIIEHVEGSRHEKKIGEIFNSNCLKKQYAYYCNICDVLTPAFVDHIENTHHIKKKWERYPDYDQLKHYIYYETNKNTPVAMAYKEIYDTLIKNNNIKCYKNQFFCNLCRIYLNPVSEISHINGKKHKNNF